MYNQVPPPQQPMNRPDAIRFVYQDGLLPVAHAKAKVLALGTSSDPQSDLKDDFEAWVGKTDGNGEIWLAHPDLIQGMDLLQQVVKRENPGLNNWYYAPLPKQRPSNVSSGFRTPRIPLMAEITDDAVGATALQVDLIPQNYNTGQSRPPIGELNGRAFLDPSAFVKQLAQRFATMDHDRSSVALTLTRCGSPAPSFLLESSWVELILQMGTTRSDFQLTTAYTKKFRAARDHVAVGVLEKVLPGKAKSKTVASGYQELLNQLAGLASKGPLGRVNVQNLAASIADGILGKPNQVFRESPMEDYVLVAAMLFLVGAIGRGYLWGTLEKDNSGSNIVLTAKINTTTSCSVDEFESYCELMKP